MLPNYPALVLNADFQPVRIHPLSTWAFDRTMRAVILDRVTVVEEYDVEFHSANLTYRPPSVVALKTYIRAPDKVAFNRQNLLIRDEYRCQYCNTVFPVRDLTFDHVVPRSRGGRSTWENAALACMPCNSRKGSKSMTPIRPPREPSSREMARKLNKTGKVLRRELHADWMSYLYWSGVLEAD